MYCVAETMLNKVHSQDSEPGHPVLQTWDWFLAGGVGQILEPPCTCFLIWKVGIIRVAASESHLPQLAEGIMGRQAVDLGLCWVHYSPRESGTAPIPWAGRSEVAEG